MRHIRPVLLLAMVALLAAFSVWTLLDILSPNQLPATAHHGQRGAIEYQLDLPASYDKADDVEEDSTAAEIVLHSQLAAFGRAQPQEYSGRSSNTLGSSLQLPRSDGHAAIVGEATGALRPSQYRGVVWSPATQNWKAQYIIQHTGSDGSRSLDLGYFDSEVQAAYSYDEAVRRRGNGHASNYELNFPTTENGFVADESLLQTRQSCARVPPEEPLRRPGIGQQLSAADCAFMPLARPEPYLSHQLMLLTDVIVALNKTLPPTARMPVMLWAVRLAINANIM